MVAFSTIVDGNKEPAGGPAVKQSLGISLISWSRNLSVRIIPRPRGWVCYFYSASLSTCCVWHFSNLCFLICQACFGRLYIVCTCWSVVCSLSCLYARLCVDCHVSCRAVPCRVALGSQDGQESRWIKERFKQQQESEIAVKHMVRGRNSHERSGLHRV